MAVTRVLLIYKCNLNLLISLYFLKLKFASEETFLLKLFVCSILGFISVVKKLVSVPVYVLIRPRPGNFNYNSYEVDQMLEDIKISKEIGADGLVFGALNK